ncbi:hypothetical protein GCM10017779_18010 [Streptomyces capillispiralis]|nr:hypothetical protein GCM10017779_18010 [Streptomyces capillispiralis]
MAVAAVGGIGPWGSFLSAGAGATKGPATPTVHADRSVHTLTVTDPGPGFPRTVQTARFHR